MSQLILDDQLDLPELLPSLQKWITARRLRELRPKQHVLDERVPEILHRLKQATFVTIDQDFWHRSLCNPHYCIIYFALRSDQQELLPGLLRELLRQPEFSTRGRRMGKVARISTARIEYWQFSTQHLQQTDWQARRRRKR